MAATDLSKEEHELVEAIRIFGGTVSGLKQRRFRFTVKVSIAFGVVLAIILAIILWLTFVIVPHIDKNSNSAKINSEKANSAVEKATSVEVKIAESELTRCKSGNDFRENDKARWDFILNLAGPPTTPEAADKLARLKNFINEADALRDCTKL